MDTSGGAPFTVGWEIVLQLLVALGGGGMIVLGLSSWLFKIWGERILRKESHKFEAEMEALKHDYATITARLEARLTWIEHANRTIFDNELKIYQQAWDRTVELRKAALSLRPQLDHIDPNEPDEARKKKRIEAFSEASENLWNVFERNRPFFPEKLYTELSELSKRARKEAIDYLHGDPKDWQRYWEEAKNGKDEIINRSAQVCDTIRARIADLSRIPARDQSA